MNAPEIHIKDFLHTVLPKTAISSTILFPRVFHSDSNSVIDIEINQLFSCHLLHLVDINTVSKSQIDN